jgi:hypothetical protein
VLPPVSLRPVLHYFHRIEEPLIAIVVAMGKDGVDLGGEIRAFRVEIVLPPAATNLVSAATLGHAPGAATGAKPALLAAEGNQLLRVALLAAHAQEAVLQAATGQVGVELLLDEIGQRSTPFCARCARNSGRYSSTIW